MTYNFTHREEPTQEEKFKKAQQQLKETEAKVKLFKEVAEHNLEMFTNEFKSRLFDYGALSTHKISQLSEEEVRQLGINFFTKMLAKKSYENQEFYFDKKLIVRQ